MTSKAFMSSVIGLAAGLAAFVCPNLASAQTSVVHDTPVLEYPLTPGSYFELAASGSGYMVDNFPRAAPRTYFFFGTIYSYDPMGKAKWYTLGNEWEPGTASQIVREQKYGSVTAQVLLSSGGNCFGCPFMPNTNLPDPTVGSLTMVQRGSSTMNVVHNGTTTVVQRLVLNPEQMVGEWKGAVHQREANGQPFFRQSGNITVTKRTDVQKVRFWREDASPIPSATDIQFSGVCALVQGLTCGILGADGTESSPTSAFAKTTFYFDGAKQEWAGLIPCVTVACTDATGAFRPTGGTWPARYGPGPIYMRVLMPTRDRLLILLVTGVPGQERIVQEEEYTRVR